MMIPLKKTVLLALLSMMTSMSACAVLNGGTETGTGTDTETKQPIVYTPFVLDVSDSSYETNEQQTTVTVSKDAVNTVKKELFGDNLSWRGNGYGVYDPETDSFNETLLEAIKNCGVTTLRYPGGIEGDYFIWHETIGEDRELQMDPFSSQYPTYYAGGDGKKYYPYFGLEEFMEMCTQIGIEAVVQLNAGTGTPKDAADLVRWCEEHNYPVSSYAIGNEVHFAEERVMFTRSTKTPEEYIDFANEVYAELGELADTV
ncbi:MAG: hypothetical protein J6S76_04650, partial [Clostridia bacterium]|nr:hypothetical protein [Clostridia bacterium]